MSGSKGGMVNLIRPVAVVFVLLVMMALSGAADAQCVRVPMDSVGLKLVPPDSIYLREAASKIVIGWYPPADSLGSITGSRNFVNWYVNDPEVSCVEIVGTYKGLIDMTLHVGRIVTGSVTRLRVGVDPSIRMLAEVTTKKDTYSKEFNLGSSYTPGTTIPMVLVGQVTKQSLDTGIGLEFSEGVVDTAFQRQPAFFEIDLQTYEGFHIWRGLTPYPSHMGVITELSRDNAFVLGIERDSLYFSEWPKKDARGRPYYEFVDNNVFVGFTYYYTVTCFDRGYFNTKTLFNKRDNFICDEDLNHPRDPEHPINCEDACKKITLTVRTSTNRKSIYAVPNPFRDGSSAEASAFYPNFPDHTIKFFNMPKEADMKVYTVSGDLVWEAHHSSPSGENGVLSWDVKNLRGEDVSSGVYIFRCESSTGAQTYGRIIIIR
jgi:hypothetical protein